MAALAMEHARVEGGCSTGMESDTLLTSATELPVRPVTHASFMAL